MLKKVFSIIILSALALAACSSQLTASHDQDVPPGEPQPAKDAISGYGGGFAGAPEQYAETQRNSVAVDGSAATGAASGPVMLPQTAGQAQAVDRLVIKNVTLALVVKDPAASTDGIAGLAQSLGGFVVNSNVYLASTDAAGNKIMQATIAIRVPADKLDEALAQIKHLSVTGQAESENISGEDVTAQYTDLESQLRNLEAAEKQLQAIMDGAKRTEDVLNVYNQLVNVRGQIEQVKGQMKYYSEAAAMSLISINLIPDALSQPLEVGGWKAEGVAKDAIEALVRAFQGLATAGIWLAIYVLPLGLLFGLPLLVIVRLALRRRKPKAAVVASGD